MESFFFIINFLLLFFFSLFFFFLFLFLLFGAAVLLLLFHAAICFFIATYPFSISRPSAAHSTCYASNRLFLWLAWLLLISFVHCNTASYHRGVWRLHTLSNVCDQEGERETEPDLHNEDHVLITRKYCNTPGAAVGDHIPGGVTDPQMGVVCMDGT